MTYCLSSDLSSRPPCFSAAQPLGELAGQKEAVLDKDIGNAFSERFDTHWVRAEGSGVGQRRGGRCVGRLQGLSGGATASSERLQRLFGHPAAAEAACRATEGGRTPLDL